MEQITHFYQVLELQYYLFLSELLCFINTSRLATCLFSFRDCLLNTATLIIISPLPAKVQEQLDKSGLWQQLAGVKHDNLLRLPPVCSFGALLSAQRFARELTAALDASTVVNASSTD
ncbi:MULTISPECIES: hypothetical protein [Halomonadaceae]|uniref:hypothetical protein n=1 Tax=Halomonadaceae TaxID=28256 RepID=UPI0012F36768|nr:MULTISPECIES: hypothetical protein [Halomonas]CAD5263688.1 hypothetical protein HALO113_160826 [Halomonas sp. 113]CAD5265736.1 hypothetical protein HALO59_160184 [Halomonas sp. 59]CAD5278483.1 hypothetical protein HALOI3_210183 [Halomonas sp. I3]CAD5284471.1 hypothetical protein HALO156_30007 [Halomonas sp. 156]VXB55487.1 hypothetical protein HALO98_170184 [Halomonas titanicae]